MSFETKGKLVKVWNVKDITTKSGKSMKVGKFMIQIDGEYPKKPVFDTFKAEYLENIELESIVNVKFDIDSSEYKDNHYPRLNAYSVYTDKSEAPKPKPQPQTETPKKDSNGKVDAPASTLNTPESDDLPF